MGAEKRGGGCSQGAPVPFLDEGIDVTVEKNLNSVICLNCSHICEMLLVVFKNIVQHL